MVHCVLFLQIFHPSVHDLGLGIKTLSRAEGHFLKHKKCLPLVFAVGSSAGGILPVKNTDNGSRLSEFEKPNVPGCRPGASLGGSTSSTFSLAKWSFCVFEKICVFPLQSSWMTSWSVCHSVLPVWFVLVSIPNFCFVKDFPHTRTQVLHVEVKCF